MEVKEVKNKSKRKKITIALLFVLAIVLVVGTSYALWQLTLTQTDINKIATGCLNMSLTDKNSINLENAYPLSNEEAEKLTPYTFVIENTCSANVDYYVNLEDITSATKKINKMYLALQLKKEGLEIKADTLEDDIQDESLVLNNAIGGKRLYEGSLLPLGKARFDLKIWLEESTPPVEEVMNASYESKVTVTGVYSNTNTTDNVLYSPSMDSLHIGIIPGDDGIQYVFNQTYVRNMPENNYQGKLKKVIFENVKNPYQDAETIIDFSQAQNGSILGYYVKDTDGKYILHIQADGKIKIDTEVTQYIFFADETTHVSFEGFENIDMSAITNMSNMFAELQHLRSIDLSKLDTSNVENMDCLFAGCSKIVTTINIMNPNISYNSIFYCAATEEGTQITLNYTLETETLVNEIVESYKDSGSNVKKGILIDATLQ